MARPLRVQLSEATYHVTARGNRGNAIYYDEDDRRVFLGICDRVVRRHAWRRLAYCLLTNHFHLVVKTPEPDLSRGMHRLNFIYAQYLNDRHSVDGHVFGGRFGAVIVTSEHQLAATIRYVAFNPVRAGLCERPSEWRWSSFHGADDSFLFGP
jgi:REP-associated tyrosine transposase